jgi:hypothetical protein
MGTSSVDRRALLGAALILPAALALPNVAFAQEDAPSLHGRLAPMSRFLGSWRGEGDGQPGHSNVERTYAPVLGGRFIFIRNVSTYAPQGRNRTGERHEDQGFYSFDRARNRVVLRQFHIESFFAQYVAASDALDGAELVFDCEAVENIPSGFRARETYRFAGPDSFEEIFETADPGGEFETYSHNRLMRVV